MMINRLYILRRVKRLLFAFVSLLTLTLILLTSLPSQGLIPDAAYIVKFQGSRLTLGAGTSRNRQPVQLQDRLESNRILYIPGDNQHWANLAFAVDSPKDHTGLVVRAGPHRTASQWSFPCTARGRFTIAWQRGRNRGCEEGIRVQSSGSATSQLLTRKALTAQGRNEVVVIPTPGESLIQTADSPTGILVDVLIGEVNVQSDRYPQGRLIRAGQRYAYPEDTVTPIDSNAILNSPELRDFVNPDNWSPDLFDRFANGIVAQLTELETAIRSNPPTLASPPPSRQPNTQPTASTTGTDLNGDWRFDFGWFTYSSQEGCTSVSPGTYTGLMTISQNGNQLSMSPDGPVPMDDGTLSGNQFQARGGTPMRWVGTVSSDGNEISGDGICDSFTMPFKLTRLPENNIPDGAIDISGKWVLVILGGSNIRAVDTIVQTGNEFQLLSGISGRSIKGEIENNEILIYFTNTPERGRISADLNRIEFPDQIMIRLGSPGCSDSQSCQI
ncbi:hypothetical protein PMG71_05955 [Roseofilum sp. BLCC_M154]|uniref:FecR protein domain-containing protein n=1 Tax=Roseofilum acuticapitatum BLCC-M154 TaxID=3022444 RepID=A0ABT7ARC0_9CYAN|nr:hypothetical protein [Roseofilum acuticapitatum]MDJ1168964.1 hypothetical protein [Roseofilum acuticapitatum BLCC-M154]